MLCRLAIRQLQDRPSSLACWRSSPLEWKAAKIAMPPSADSYRKQVHIAIAFRLDTSAVLAFLTEAWRENETERADARKLRVDVMSLRLLVRARRSNCLANINQFGKT